MSLFDSLSAISEQIKNQRHLINNEAATEMVSVRPFIRALDYDIFNLAEVEPQYTADPNSSGTDRVDYVIKREGDPIMLVEIKSANTTLNPHHWKQLHSYFVALDVEFGVLTNGLEYRFYTDTKKSNVMDEVPFLTIDMLKLDAAQVNTLEGFSKSRFAPEQTLRKIKISNLLDKELSKPSNEFVKHFARQVHSGSIFQSVIEEFRPLVKRAWDDLVDQEIARRLRRPADEDVAKAVEHADQDSEDTTNETETLPDITALVPLFLRYKGEILAQGATLTLTPEIDLRRKSCIQFQGKDWTIGGGARAIIYPTIAPARPSMNGYGYWRVVDPLDGKDHGLYKIWEDQGLAARLLEAHGKTPPS